MTNYLTILLTVYAVLFAIGVLIGNISLLLDVVTSQEKQLNACQAELIYTNQINK